jgi:hypothetical protein
LSHAHAAARRQLFAGNIHAATDVQQAAASFIPVCRETGFGLHSLSDFVRTELSYGPDQLRPGCH